MKKVGKRLQVQHFAQVPCKPYCVDVVDEFEAKKIIDILAFQHLFLEKQRIIPDYSSVILVVMWDETIENENRGMGEWVDYYNEEEGLDWDEFEALYLTKEAIELNNKKIAVADKMFEQLQMWDSWSVKQAMWDKTEQCYYNNRNILNEFQKGTDQTNS